MVRYPRAACAGNLTSINAVVPSGQPGAPDRPVSVWTTPDRIQNFQWALHSAVAILPRCLELHSLHFRYGQPSMLSFAASCPTWLSGMSVLPTGTVNLQLLERSSSAASECFAVR